MSRVNFRGNKATTSSNNGQGGAFMLGLASGGRVGHVSLTDVTVGGSTVADGNVSQGQYGGGMIVNADSVSITNSRFENNVAQNGNVGGLYILGTLSSTVSVTNTSFTANSATGSAGGLWISNNGSSVVTLRSVFVLNNTARRHAGLWVSGNVGLIDARELLVTGNVANESVGGAGFDGNNGPQGVNISDSYFNNNTVTNGSIGGLSVTGQLAPTRLMRVEVRSNIASKGTTNYAASGGAAFNNNASVHIVDGDISDNTSDFHIGAIQVSASSSPFDPATGLPLATLPPTTNTFTVERTTISGNATNPAGNIGFATIFVTTPGIYRFINSTIAGNTSSGCGGGITADGFNPSSQTNAMQIQVRNSTIARNTGLCQEGFSVGAYNPAAPSTPGAFNGSVTIESSIIAGRSFGAMEPVADVPNGTALTVSNSLLERDFGGALNATCGTSGVLCNLDAKLCSLAPNGGVTRTLALLAGSPALNRGSNSLSLPRDQRNATRTQGAAVDMGAFEALPGGNCTLDMDGIGGVQGAKVGLVLVRSMLGFDDSAAVAGTGISSSQWGATKANLNANCGTAGSFAP